jgi:hypothetical protein
MTPPPLEIAIPLLLVIGVLFYSLGYQIGDALALRHAKEKLHIPNPSKWLKNKYKLYLAKQVLPTLRPKEKESPVVGPDPVSPILPKCPKLDGAEKGKNIMFRVRAPYSAPDNEIEITTNETKITITHSHL